MKNPKGRLLLIFLFFIIFSFPKKIVARDFYTVDVKNYFFSRWPYSTGEYKLENPPPGKTFNDLVKNFDLLSFLVSLQGIVNRDKPQFLLFADSEDENWLTELRESGLFPSDFKRNHINYSDDISLLNKVINLFKNQNIIKGSVVWSEEKPYSLNLAFIIAGVEDLVIVRKSSPYYSLITQNFSPVKDLTVN